MCGAQAGSGVVAPEAERAVLSLGELPGGGEAMLQRLEVEQAQADKAMGSVRGRGVLKVSPGAVLRRLTS